MRGIRFLNEFAGWRWAPTVALIGGTLLYISIVLLLVPSEIGVPGMNTKFVPRSSHGSATGSGSDAGGPFSFGAGKEGSGDTSSADDHDVSPASLPAQAVIPPQAPGNFGRRGFSPPLERAPPPPMPDTPPVPTPESAPPPGPPSTAEAAVTSTADAQPAPPPPSPDAIEHPGGE
jgi:hypothetical protein